MTPTTPAPVAPREDGRLLRSRRTRDRVLDAYLALLREGDGAPTSARIAQRAQVSCRTVFAQFEDLETLRRLAGRRVLDEVVAATRPVDPALPLPDRVAAYAGGRARVLELLHPVASAARLLEPSSAALAANRDRLLALSRQEIREVFGPELAAVPPARRDALVLAVALLSDWAAWWQLREESRLPPAEAEQVVRTGVGALLAGLG
ncbi:MAG: TetR/AcrR family transcriptional regulator [Mycobacteriales bacterium]